MTYDTTAHHSSIGHDFKMSAMFWLYAGYADESGHGEDTVVVVCEMRFWDIFSLLQGPSSPLNEMWWTTFVGDVSFRTSCIECGFFASQDSHLKIRIVSISSCKWTQARATRARHRLQTRILQRLLVRTHREKERMCDPQHIGLVGSRRLDPSK